MRSWLLLAPAALAACAPSSGTDGSAEPDRGAPTSSRASLPTPWARVRPPRDISLLEVPALVLSAPEARGVVVPPYPARIARVRVRPGQRVERGAALVDVVMPQVLAAAGAQAAARTRRQAWSRRRRQLQALKAEGLAKTVDLSEAETREAEAKAEEQAALATLRIAGLSPSEGARLLAAGGVLSLRSPLAGVVIEVNAEVGETRDAGGAALVRIASQGPTRVEARLSHRIGEAARFELLTPDGERIPLRLLSQSPVVDPRDGTRLAWLEPERHSPLPGGQGGRLRVLPLEGEGVVAVPAAAVSPGEPAVLRRQGDRVRRVPVRVLAASGADALVQGALEPGDEVAADARLFPPDGGLP